MSSECAERLRLVEEYSRAITEYGIHLGRVKGRAEGRQESEWIAVEEAFASSQHAWEVLEKHIAEHHCLDLHWARTEGADAASDDLLGKAAAAALDIILVADDERRFVDVNEAAAEMLGLPRSELVGRRSEEFFSEARGQKIHSAWDDFVAEGVQSGICELRCNGEKRRFEYRAKANFAPGLHLSVLREQSEN